jgi:hypothetical protein
MRCQHSPGLISSLPGTAGLPPFISFSTSYLELYSAFLRHADNERLVRNSEVNLGRLPKEEWIDVEKSFLAT